MTQKLLDPVLLQTDIPELQLHASGKVRDVYQLDNERLLFVATDRISAFDYVLATGIPHKGRVLTQISLFWFDFLSDIRCQPPHHRGCGTVSATAAEICRSARRTVNDRAARPDVSRRVRRARLHFRLGLEGIQGDREGLRHQFAGGACASPTRSPSRSSLRPPRPPVATMKTIPFSKMCDIVGTETASTLRDLTLRVYKKAAD